MSARSMIPTRRSFESKTDTVRLDRASASSLVLNGFVCDIVPNATVGQKLPQLVGKTVEITWHLGVQNNRPIMILDAAKESSGAPAVEDVMRDVRVVVYGQVDKLEAASSPAPVRVETRLISRVGLAKFSKSPCSRPVAFKYDRRTT